MKRKEIVKVKQKHIDEGLPENCVKCAVALAVKDKFPEFSVSISEKYGSNGMIYSINLFEENISKNTFFSPTPIKTKFNKFNFVNDFIFKFDTGFYLTELKPFEFELTVYEMWVKVNFINN